MRLPRTLGLLAATALLAATSAVTASAKSTEIALEVTGDEQVLVGERHELTVTATKTADDPSNPIGCVELTAPSGWTGLRIEAGVLPTSGWSADDGPPATWSADTGGGKLQDLGQAAEVVVSAVAPGAPETGTWTVTLYDSVTCSDTPMLSTTFDVDVVTALAELTIDPASATVTVGAAHAVTFTAEWLASAGDQIGCLAVSLPAGWTGIAATGMGAPTGWSSATDGQVITWSADTAGDVIDATGESASFTVTATAPDAPGASDWDVDVLAALDCTGMALLSGTAEVTLESEPVIAEASLTLTPATASITVGTAHAVDVTAAWIGGEGDGIGCVVVTLPAGWTAPALSDGLPTMGWTADVDATAGTVTWRADTLGDMLDMAGETASFTVTATAPTTAGDAIWDGDAFAALDCTGEPALTDTALVTLVAAPTGGGGDDGGDGAEDLVPDVLATDPPVPGSIPAGEGPGATTGMAALLATLAVAVAALAAVPLRLEARRRREEVTAR